MIARHQRICHSNPVSPSTVERITPQQGAQMLLTCYMPCSQRYFSLLPETMKQFDSSVLDSPIFAIISRVFDGRQHFLDGCFVQQFDVRIGFVEVNDF